MKKYLLLLLILFTFGCSLNNSPKSKVEELFSKYNMLDKEIENEIDTIINNQDDLTSEQKERYKKVIEKQYRNLTYEIKDEEIDGNTSIVKVEIEVMDYKKVINEIDNEYLKKESYLTVDYNNSKLDRLESCKDKVVYTLELTVIKDSNGNWNLNKLDETLKKKMLGMY